MVVTNMNGGRLCRDVSLQTLHSVPVGARNRVAPNTRRVSLFSKVGAVRGEYDTSTGDANRRWG